VVNRVDASVFPLAAMPTFAGFIPHRKIGAIAKTCEIVLMNNQLNQTAEPTGGKGVVVVSLLATETTVHSTGPGNSAGKGLMHENEVQHRAEAMTDVLQKIMDRPPAIRHWGLNE
jgi:hypothetical protein